MSEQIRREKTTSQEPSEVTVENGSTEEDRDTSEKLKAETDELLDEIDGLLEDNAAEFVRNYIQKGGQ